VVLEGAVEPEVFHPASVVVVPKDEAQAANVLDLGSVVLMPPRCPETRAELQSAGLHPIEIDASEFALIDGALTCLSVIFEG
jgi:N-dimethylarginine dimethylaminohydrolase